MDTHYFAIPFATSGTKTAIPSTVQGDGSISYPAGYGVDYSLDPDSDPAALLVDRATFNQAIFDVTSSLARLQQDYPQWISSSDNLGSPYPYNMGVVVRYSDNLLYQSNSNGNTATPGASGWTLFLSQYATSVALAAEVTRAMAAEALLAPIAGPTFTGNVGVPNLAPGTNDTRAANTNFVTSAVAAEAARASAAEALLAPIASPNFTGSPAIGGQAIATQAYAAAAVAAEASRALAAEALLAPIANPTFTGNVNVGTVAGNDASTKAASTNWVRGLLGNLNPVQSAGHMQIGQFQIRWVVGGYDPGDNTEPSYTLNWDVAFPTACLAACVSMDLQHAGGTGSSGMDSWYQTAGFGTGGVVIQRQNNGQGDWHIPTRAVVIAVGY